ncbi:MAG: hypothetical protein EU532_06420 [Promethearchaeota archaeon]|nr:MAG: hypothetical protein EU532_06420 [Candidatus Lokiarchaeota archaeon]
MSYLERTLMWFLKNRIFGGIQKLKQKEYITFTLIILLIMGINTGLAILINLQILTSIELIRTMLIFELFLAFALIVTGIIIGRINNLFVYYSIASIIMIVFVLAFLYLNWTYELSFFTYAKLFFFFVWISISSVSLFFLILYFFTSFPKKVITLGMPKDHIFFGPILKFVAYISIPLYILMIFQFDASVWVFGILGIVNSLIVLDLMRIAPKKMESKPGIINFATAVGFFNFFVFYHLIMSFTYVSESTLSLILEIIMLSISVLYLVQTLTRRISEAPDRPIPFENPVQFQSRIYFTYHLKQFFGERGVVLMVLGMAMGYHMVYLDSFYVSDYPIGNFPILSTFINPALRVSDLYHRIYLLLSFLIIITAWLTFKASSRFREFMVDKFTIRQVFKYIGAFFTRPEEGESPFEVGVKMVSQKIGEGVKNWNNKWRASIEKLLRDTDENDDIQ